MQLVAVGGGYSSRGSRRRRVTAAALALAVALLLVLLLILAGVIPQITVPVGSGALSTFNLAGGEQAPPSPRPQPKAKPAAKRAPPPAPARTLPPPVVKIPPSRTAQGMIVLSQDDFAAADIGRIHGTADAGTTGTATAAADSAAVYGPGAGPGGKRYFAVQWYREPTQAEMQTYLPHNDREGWGTVACRTIERYHVDDCRVIDETPGSGLGHAVQEASWQFLVRPPQIDGKPQLGVWIRIRYDLIRGFVK